MTAEFILTNARIVLHDAIVDGTVVVRDGKIAEIDTATSAAGEDMDGELLMPGLVEVHTDHLEKHAMPRRGVFWNPMTALFAHDAQLCGAGITTVLDAVRIGDSEHEVGRSGHILDTIEQIADCREKGLLRSDHLLHIRCEVSSPDVIGLFEDIQDQPLIRLVSLMDHTPGQRQFTDLGQWREYYGGKTGIDDKGLQELREGMEANAEKYSDPHRRHLAAACRDRGYVLASHDDATEEHVAEAIELGLTVCEFPTTHEAAAAAKREGMRIVAGAPNVVRGGSHSGNVSAVDLATSGNLDALSSDYVPVSLLHSAFLLRDNAGIALPVALRLISSAAAETVGLDDRGEIAVGKRADLIQVSDGFAAPVVRRVWREGNRVA